MPVPVTQNLLTSTVVTVLSQASNRRARDHGRDVLARLGLAGLSCPNEACQCRAAAARRPLASLSDAPATCLAAP
jgi:hypothetical protein